jgi:hypothetical protein
VRPIELLPSAVAARFAGASGGTGAETTIVRVVVLDAPSSSVTVSDAVYVPASE